MATFTMPVRISDMAGRRSTTLDMLVDTGATMSLVPRSTLSELGIRPLREMEFILADQSGRTYQVGRALIRLDGVEEVLPVIFGDDDTEPLLGQSLWKSSASQQTPYMDGSST
ncbi:MAG: hypothetical protein FJ320_11585 [SAR202 cluster bacterium]|nr:hypothetical protein [SAR202 cluster bacterium]